MLLEFDLLNYDREYADDAERAQGGHSVVKIRGGGLAR